MPLVIEKPHESKSVPDFFDSKSIFEVRKVCHEKCIQFLDGHYGHRRKAFQFEMDDGTTT